MTPRERWLAVLAREKPDRVPMDYWATPEFSARLIRHLGLSRRGTQALTRMLSRKEQAPGYLNEGRLALRRALQRLRVDFVIHVGPSYVGPALPANTDVFGCLYRDVDYGAGIYSEVVAHPLAPYGSVEEIEASYRWPSPDWYDYRGLPDQIRDWENYPVQGGGSEPFLIYKNLRGQEQAMIDLVEHPAIVHYCLDKLFDLAYRDTERILETIPGKVVYCYVAEDMGGQNNLMFSKKHIRTFLLPRMKQMIDLAHQGGAYVFHHNDGNCRAILPDLIDAGIDVLNPHSVAVRGDGTRGAEGGLRRKPRFPRRGGQSAHAAVRLVGRGLRRSGGESPGTGPGWGVYPRAVSQPPAGHPARECRRDV